MTKRTIVEINGRKYDANTGQMVTDSPAPSKMIDGFQAPIAAAKVSRNVNQASQMHQKPQKTKKLHPAAAKAEHKRKTVVSKSNPTEKSQISEVQKSELDQRYAKATGRHKRAALHKRSSKVSRFQDEPVSEETPASNSADVAAAPVAVMPKPVAAPKKPAPQPMQEAVKQEQVSADTEGRLARLRKKRPKIIPATITAVLVLGITGYITYQNLPNMALRIASSRAGFSASLPGYSPSGFSFSGPVAYSDGVIELEYSSNSDDRAYRLTQKESSWDSQSLLDNFVESRNEEFLTFQERGLTVYVYENSNATWVDGGVWYTIEGNSLLSSEQLLKIAGSL